jgi:hypothetical protein
MLEVARRRSPLASRIRARMLSRSNSATDPSRLLMSRPTAVPVSTPCRRDTRATPCRSNRSMSSTRCASLREFARETVQRRHVHRLHLSLPYECEERVERKPVPARAAYAVVGEHVADAAAVNLGLRADASFLEGPAVRLCRVLFDRDAGVGDDHCCGLRRTVGWFRRIRPGRQFVERDEGSNGSFFCAFRVPRSRRGDPRSVGMPRGALAALRHGKEAQPSAGGCDVVTAPLRPHGLRSRMHSIRLSQNRGREREFCSIFGRSRLRCLFLHRKYH